jgi:hypothetical protein
VNGHDQDRAVSLEILAHRLPAGAAFRDLLTGERLEPSPGDGIPVAALDFRILLVE